MRMFALLLILLSSSNLFAQPDTVWTRRFGGIGDEYGSGVIVRDDGSFVVSGTTNSFGAGASDYYLLRLSASGDTIRTRTFGTPDDEWCAGILGTPPGNLWAFGYTYVGSSGHYRAYYNFFDSTFMDILGGAVFDDSTDYYGFAGCPGPHGYPVLTGSRNFSSGASNIFASDVEFNQGFLTECVRGYKSAAHSIKPVASGGYILGGFTQASENESPDFLLLRLDGNGDTLWTRVIGGDNSDEINCVIQTSDGGFAFTGPTDSYGVNGDVVLFKTDSLGVEQWHRTYGGDSEEHGHIVIQTPDHGYFLAGHTESFGTGGDVIAIKTDSLGNQQWLRHWGGDGLDVAESAALTNDGGYILVGTTTSFGGRDADLWVLRISPELSIQNSNPAQINDMALAQNYPNPFNAETRIRFNLSHPQSVTLKLFDLQGRFVQSLAEGQFTSGNHEVHLNADNLPTGIYFYRLSAGAFSDTKKMILLK
jgi:hypothetical protein